VHFSEPLLPARLIRRYQRFLADVRLEDGNVATVHCPNSGSMCGCLGEGWPVLLSRSDNPKRKYPLTWEMVHDGRGWIGINTHLANRLAAEAIADGVIGELAGYEAIRREVPYGASSRVDLVLEGHRGPCYVEVKNVTMVDERGRYAFPDAVTERGRKHLVELSSMVASGHRAVMLFVIQRSDGRGFAPADNVDPRYAEAVRHAFDTGVEILAYRADVQPEAIEVIEKVQVHLET
jgi:sugar fermentation stimulation protein A